jgi:hypothetical protein
MKRRAGAAIPMLCGILARAQVVHDPNDGMREDSDRRAVRQRTRIRGISTSCIV